MVVLWSVMASSFLVEQSAWQLLVARLYRIRNRRLHRLGAAAPPPRYSALAPRAPPFDRPLSRSGRSRNRRVVSTATDDRDLVRRFEAMFREHYPAVLRFGLRRASRAVAEDAAAETFAAAWRSMDVVPLEHPLPWLLTVARRQLAKQH